MGHCARSRGLLDGSICRAAADEHGCSCPAARRLCREPACRQLCGHTGRDAGAQLHLYARKKKSERIISYASFHRALAPRGRAGCVGLSSFHDTLQGTSWQRLHDRHVVVQCVSLSCLLQTMNGTVCTQDAPHLVPSNMKALLSRVLPADPATAAASNVSVALLAPLPPLAEESANSWPGAFRHLLQRISCF